MTSQDQFILVERLVKHFGQVTAVDSVTFGIRKGEFFSILGPSGCGKTTLLRMLAGFELPDSGEIYIDQQPMSAVPANRRPTNMVFQNYAIFPHLNVAQNIAYGLRRRGLGRGGMRSTVESALERVRLPGYGQRRASQLSGGERQRVALARALVCEPKVLLLDEPLGALDKKLREEMQLELRELQRAVGITFILVTHDQEEALIMSDRIAVMSKGKVLQIDSALDLYEDPNCRDVASFIGSMNFIDVIAAEVVDGILVGTGGALGRLSARLAPSSDVTVGAPVTIAVRPEKIEISEAPPASDQNRLRGRLIAQVYLGDRNHYFVRVDGLAATLTVAAQNQSRPTFGRADEREVWVSWPAAACFVVNAATRSQIPTSR